MLANYGYKDASGDFFITINTDLCNGCGDCVSVCPSMIYKVLNEDPNDPLREEPVVIVKDSKKKKLKYECSPCKNKEDNKEIICIQACKQQSISHSW